MSTDQTMRRSLILAAALVASCTQALVVSNDDSKVVLAHQSITAANPGEKGSFAVRTMFYGSGTDKRRTEFRDSVTIKTRTVDLSPFVSAEPDAAKSREKDWGFGFSKAPINGRVWYP